MHIHDDQTAPESQGLALGRGQGITRLKWHRLRRQSHDPLFSADIMAAGFALGASMELDLRVRADGGFAVLHDAALGRETEGQGLVREMDRTDLCDLRHRDVPRPILLSEDMAGLLTAAHPHALIQFDMKDDLATIGQQGIDHLVAHFSHASAPIIVSGDCPDLIVAIRDQLPMLQRGIDPTDRLVACYHRNGPGAVEKALVQELRGPTQPDTVYLAWELLLRAHRAGLDLVALCQAEGMRVDAWTFTPADPAAGLSGTESQDFADLMALQPDQITTDDAMALEKHWNAIGSMA